MTIQDNFLSRERAGSASNRGAPVLPGRGGGGGLAVSLRRPGLRPGKFEYIYKYLGINKLYHHILLSLRGMREVFPGKTKKADISVCLGRDGADDRARTCNQVVNSHLLCH